MEALNTSSKLEEQCEDLEKVFIDAGGKYFQVIKGLLLLEKVQLLLLLVNNIDIFSWSPYKAPGVDLDFICHKLNVDPKCTLKKQKPRRSSNIHSTAVKEEVDKLKGDGAIGEVF